MCLRRGSVSLATLSSSTDRFQGLCTDLLIQPEETQVGRNRGAGGAAEPRQLTLGVGLAGL